MMRDHIKIVEAFSAVERLPFREQKQEALDSLDRLLGCQDCSKKDKAAALMEIAIAAKRMAENIVRWEQQKAAQDEASIENNAS